MSESSENIRTPAAPPVVLPYDPTPLAAPVPITPGAKAWEVRLWSGFIFGLCAVLLAVGMYLHPSDKGMGTHRALGLPPCGLQVMTGYPCPTCGCTTAVSWVAHGHPLRALLVQPFGAAVGYVAWVGVVLGLVGLISGKWVGPSPFFMQWHLTTIMLGVLALLLSAWVYKIVLVRWGLG